MNIWDILILGAVALAVFSAVRRICRKKNSGCSGMCSCCEHGCKQGGDSAR